MDAIEHQVDVRLAQPPEWGQTRILSDTTMVVGQSGINPCCIAGEMAPILLVPARERMSETY